jgi:type IV secretion system protein VirD4
LAKAGESFITTDPKGELFAKTSGYVKKQGYKTIALDFRNADCGNCWNPFTLPYKLYNSGKQDMAMSMFNDFAMAITADQQKSTADPFWGKAAKAYLVAILLIMAECCTEEEMNMRTLAQFCTIENANYVECLARSMTDHSIAGMNIKSIYTAAGRTMRSILISVHNAISEFISSQSITNLISQNDVNIIDAAREKTAIYLIIPDEKTTTHFLATLFIKQAYEVLIAEAQKEKDFKLPVRLNFILDEFCNMPKIEDMPSMITAARSRNMRFYLIAQSLHQLKGKYKEDADTIKGNCDNWVFLTSREYKLLEEISNLCGILTMANRTQRSLISTSELQRLRKEKGEALILHSREYPFISEMADIDQYKSFIGYESAKLEKIHFGRPIILSPSKLYKEIVLKHIPYPFSDEMYYNEATMARDTKILNKGRAED